MFFTSDDSTGLPTKFAGFDLNEPTAHQGGKPAAIAKLRNRHPYDTIAMASCSPLLPTRCPRVLTAGCPASCPTGWGRHH